MESDSPLNAEINHEQRFVDRAYLMLDRLRKRYRERQRHVEASQWRNTPQALSERDAFAAHWGDEASRLEAVVDRLVFGRIDNVDASTHYIGRIGLRDDQGEQFLIDWRAPASKPFYQATGANPQGVLRRRHIQTRGRTVVGLEDELLDASAARDDQMVFQGEGALMEALTQARDGRMTDIVATIQAEQDAIIRKSSDGLLVIQGGPGTGKTAVALHRAAYLLYAERARLENAGVLILCPSRVFLNYIDQVLPSLGENGVVSTTLSDLLPGYRAQSQDEEDVREIKGRMDWVDIAKRAVRSYERVCEDTPLRIASYKVTLRSQAVRTARTNARRSGKPHNEAWEGFALELMEDLARQMEQQYSSQEALSWYFDYIRASLDARKAINLAWLPVSALFVLERLYFDPAFLKSMAPNFTQAEREALYRPRGSALTEDDIPILDELEELLGDLPSHNAAARQRENQRFREVEAAGQAIASMGLGGGLVNAQMLAERARAESSQLTLAQRALKDRTWAYGHIIVDEAQEITPLAWNSLMRRCPSRSFTVTGDLDQRSASAAGKTWQDLLGPACRAWAGEEVLTVSYRTPGSILRRAEDLMREVGRPARYPVTAARDVADAYEITTLAYLQLDDLQRIVAEESARLDERVGSDAGRIAIITDPQALTRIQQQQHWDTSLHDRVSIMSALQAKGLEFDTVILWEPANILEHSPGDLYVSMTRPTMRLRVVTSKPLPRAFSE